MSFIVNIGLYFIAGLIFSSFYFIFIYAKKIFSINFIFLYIFIYILISFLLFLLGLEFVSLLLILIYSGGLLILLIFSHFMFTNNLFNKESPVWLPVMYKLFSSFLVFLLFLILTNLQSIFFCNLSVIYKEIGLYLSCINTNEYMYNNHYEVFWSSLFLAKWYSSFDSIFFFLNNDNIVIYGNLIKSISTLHVVSYYFYVKYFISYIAITLLLFLSLIGVVMTFSLYDCKAYNKYSLNYFKKNSVELESFIAHSLYLNLYREVYFAYDQASGPILFPFISSTDFFLKKYEYQIIIFDNILLISNLLFVLCLYSLLLMSRFNIIKYLLIIELMFLALILKLCCISYHLDDIDGLILVIYCLGILAAETAIGLSIYNIYFSQNEKK